MFISILEASIHSKDSGFWLSFFALRCPLVADYSHRPDGSERNKMNTENRVAMLPRLCLAFWLDMNCTQAPSAEEETCSTE